MDWLISLDPFWVWIAIAALLVTAEVSTGSGWLLWPAGAAVVVAVLTAVADLGLPMELAIFAVVTSVSALLGRRFLPKALMSTPDINDNVGRLVGHEGRMVGVDRVFIDGKDWAAVADEALEAGQRVEVVAAQGSVLRVRAL